MLIALIPASGDPYTLAQGDDVVTGFEVADDAVVETVRLFRRATGEQRPRGGQLVSFACVVERVHATHEAAVAYTLQLRRDLRTVQTGAPVRADFTLGATSWSLATATVLPGPSRLLGIRSIQPLRITGALV